MHRRPRLSRPALRSSLAGAGERLKVPLLVGLLSTGLLLAGCAARADVPAPSADSTACRAAIAAAPDAVLDRGSVAVDGTATRAWGRPPVVVRCGLDEPAPTSTGCITVDDVDWVVDVTGDPITAVTFGRSPALEVRLPASLGRQAVPAALVDLTPMAVVLPRTAHACVG